jgi:hypothetical protein
MLRDDFSSLTKEAFASKLADTLADREVLLKICAMNLYEIEENSRPERLVDYKQAFKESLEIFCGCLRQFFPILSLSVWRLSLCLSNGKAESGNGAGRYDIPGRIHTGNNRKFSAADSLGMFGKRMAIRP